MTTAGTVINTTTLVNNKMIAPTNQGGMTMTAETKQQVKAEEAGAILSELFKLHTRCTEVIAALRAIGGIWSQQQDESQNPSLSCDYESERLRERLLNQLCP